MPDESTRDALALLARAPLFSGLDESALQIALAESYRRRVRRGEFYFLQDDPATTFYVLLEGRARLSQLTPEGHQITIRYVGPGDGMGIIVALSDMAYPLSAEAVQDCLALAWEAGAVRRLMEQYPSLALGGLQLVAERFRHLQARYLELATERVERRVARALLRLARQAGKRVENGILLDLPLSRQDLGEMTGTTLYTVSRILSGWEQDGIISTGRERIVICKPHGLVTIAEDLPPER
ncbi:MAG TPA: Crp/Fnr family transcriptional regulator [Candidatus Binatia bacterium]|nr:Crp/Fnr family transcriptional regulator [Candidatus Binatia bacterium]